MNNDVDLSAALSISIILMIVIAYISHYVFKIRWWSSITLGLLIGYLVLNLMYPIGILMYERRLYVIVLYLIIEISVPIFLFLYFFKILLTDYE